MSVRAALTTALLVWLGACAAARADRDWYPYLARTVQVSVEGETARIDAVSDWSYGPEGPVSEEYRRDEITLSELRHVWFVIEPQPGSRIAAHTLLLFEFEGDRLLGLTIEARRERDESYSALRGVFNTYELAYVWASARDLLTRRAVMLGHEVYIYPIAISEEQKTALLRSLFTRTQALAAHPRFYNTFGANCTNELAKAAGLNWNFAFVLTGTSDEYLFREGLIPGESFAAAERRARLTDFVKDLNGAPPADFDRLLLARLRGDAPG